MTSIAEETGVSVAVVSRLLRGDPTLRVSDQRRREIFEARDRLGGVKSRPRMRTQTIIAPFGTERDPAWIKRNIHGNKLYQSFEGELQKQGYRLRFASIPEQEVCAQLKRWINAPRRPDGMLLGWSYCTPELADLLRTYAFPHVTDDFTIEHLQINTVCNHATAGMRLAVEHLAGLGHRRIGFIGPAGLYRYPMMVSSMVGLNLPIDPAANCVLPGARYPDDPDRIRVQACDVFDQWHERHRDITAWIASNDYAAMGVVDAMRQRGLVPGKDLSIVGYDNIEGHYPCAFGEPILTTIDNPLERVGRRMAELLLNQILYGQTSIIHERVPVSLVVRGTTGPAPNFSSRSRI